MELTVAGGEHITVHVPCVPDLFKPGAMQLAHSSSLTKKGFGKAIKSR